jgi:hypothetical protein
MVSMIADHVGAMFFPSVVILRIIGRIAFPIFAFMIAEGAQFTRNKIRYFALIFLLGAGSQVVFYILEQSLYMCILITFSISILTIYALQFFKKKLIQGSLIEKIYSFLIFASCVVLAFFLNKWFEIDYGFWGSMLPVFASVFRFDFSKNVGQEQINRKLDFIPINLLTFAIGLVLVCRAIGGIQYYALLSLIVLFFYSGKRGKLKLKYFFYAFYPTHLAILYGISMLIG